jgi:RNA 3'-terminal phosphate cyclase (ATP)
VNPRSSSKAGTHNPWAPPFDFLQRAFVPLVNQLGPHVETTLKRPGFYPAGGGAFTVTVTPARAIGGLELMDRGEAVARRVTAMVANLPRHIAQREVRVALDGLNWHPECGSVMDCDGVAGPGNIVLIELQSERVTEIATGFGEIGVAAEAVAGQAVKEMRRYLTAGVPVGSLPGRSVADRARLERRRCVQNRVPFASCADEHRSDS